MTDLPANVRIGPLTTLLLFGPDENPSKSPASSPTMEDAISKNTRGKILMLAGKSEFPATLSDRELEILDLVATGLTNLEISQHLEISKRTVDNHISNILTKTKTDNRVELVRWALQWGKVCLNEVNCCVLPHPSLPNEDN